MQTLTIRTEANEQPKAKIEPTAEYIRQQLELGHSQYEDLSDLQEVDRWFTRECIEVPAGGLQLEPLV